jgi:hypothetical protein
MTIGNQTNETVNRLKINLYLCQILKHNLFIIVSCSQAHKKS